jgi:hypothetical protein
MTELDFAERHSSSKAGAARSQHDLTGFDGLPVRAVREESPPDPQPASAETLSYARSPRSRMRRAALVLLPIALVASVSLPMANAETAGT